jgi:hypothetical protein
MPNLYQKALLTTYANGEYAYLLDMKTPHDFELKVSQLDDKLLQFMLIQLGQEDDSKAEFQDILLALGSLEKVLDALKNHGSRGSYGTKKA